MRKGCALLAVFLAAVAQPTLAAEQVTVYLFSTKRCVNCANEKKFLSELSQRVPGFVVRDLDVMADPANARLLTRAAAEFNVQARGAPVTSTGRLACTPPAAGSRSASV